LKIPVINLVTGEGGSGGALAIGMGDVLIMLQYSIYSVISPEACSTILWRNPDETEAAADAMGISSKRLSKLGLVDSVIEEPLGGFHKDPKDTFQRITKTLDEYLYNLKNKNIDDLLLKRRQRYKAIGEFNEI
jgi:acetyl-CoA carboxylase carboxyl transferase subunit alpha